MKRPPPETPTPPSVFDLRALVREEHRRMTPTALSVYLFVVVRFRLSRCRPRSPPHLPRPHPPPSPCNSNSTSLSWTPSMDWMKVPPLTSNRFVRPVSHVALLHPRCTSQPCCKCRTKSLRRILRTASLLLGLRGAFGGGGIADRVESFRVHLLKIKTHHSLHALLRPPP